MQIMQINNFRDEDYWKDFKLNFQNFFLCIINFAEKKQRKYLNEVLYLLIFRLAYTSFSAFYKSRTKT
jgi:hypothetical protein